MNTEQPKSRNGRIRKRPRERGKNDLCHESEITQGNENPHARANVKSVPAWNEGLRERGRERIIRMGQTKDTGVILVNMRQVRGAWRRSKAGEVEVAGNKGSGEEARASNLEIMPMVSQATPRAITAADMAVVIMRAGEGRNRVVTEEGPHVGMKA